MTVDESFVGRAGEHGSELQSLELGWIDLERNNSDDDAPRDSELNFPSRRHNCRSYEVVLECSGNEHWESHFQNDTVEPTVQDDIIRFWEGLFQVGDALVKIHDAESNEDNELFQGLHQDVKPANMLMYNRSSRGTGEWSFQLADLGISHFKSSSSGENDIRQGKSSRTRTYGAPECHRPREFIQPNQERSTQNVDIWSLGCVFLEAAVWLEKRHDSSSYSDTQNDHAQLKPISFPGVSGGRERKRAFMADDPIRPAESRLAQRHKTCNDLLQDSQSWKAPEILKTWTIWNDIKSLLERLQELTSEYDKDGLDLFSGSGSKNCVSEKDTRTAASGLRNSVRIAAENDVLDLSPINSDNSTLQAFSKRYAVLNWLHSCILASDSIEDNLVGGSWNQCISNFLQQRKSMPRTQGTGQWLLKDEQFIRWRSRPEGVLWLTGSPGCGKSVLTSMVIEELENYRQHGEYFVNFNIDPDSRGLSTVSGILWKMLVQTRLRTPAEKSQLELQQALADLAYAGDQISSSRMKHIFSQIRHSLKGDETLCLFVDGLSDFESQNERDLLYEFFRHAGRSDPNHRIKVFISSSPNFFGRRNFEGSSRVDLDHHPMAKLDLTRYIKGALQRRIWDEEAENFSKRLCHETGGSFLRARLVLQSAGLPSLTASPLKQIGECLSGSIRTDFPSIYATIVGQIENRNSEVAKLTFGWLSYAARPLHIAEIREALQMRTNTELNSENIVQICDNLVVIDENQIMRLAHYTVQEFLESPLNRSRYMKSSEANEMIVDTCLKTLYPQTLLQSLRLHTKPLRCPTVDKASRRQQPLLSYAYRYWIFHYKLAEPGSSYIAGLLHGFLSKCFSSLDLVNTALWIGARFGFRKLVRLELDMGANINLASGPEKYTALIWAAKAGHLDVVKLLLEYGADPQIACASGMTALTFAVAKGHLEVVELLLGYGAQYQLASASEQELSPTRMAALGVAQELSLETTFSAPCTTCGAVETGYKLSVVHGTSKDDDKLPSITVKGEYISRAEMDLLTSNPSLHKSTAFPGKSRKAGQKRSIKWFPGAKMHRSLELAARRGIEDFKKLLVAVGNDINDLDSIMSVSKLVAKIRIS